MASTPSSEPLPAPVSEVASLRQEVASLKREIELLHSVLDALPYAIFWKDRNLQYLGENRMALVHSGFASSAEIRGRTDDEMPWTREQTDAFRADDREVITSGKPKPNIIEALRLADGSERWLETHKAPLRDASGNVVGVIGWVEDITERKQEEEEQARRKDELIRYQTEALQELSTPLLPVADGVLVMPLMGRIDQARARQVMETLLAGVAQHCARAAILDVTGVRQVDRSVIDALVAVARAVRLLGAEAIVTGIRPEVAQTVIDLALDLHHLVILRDLKSGVAHALGGHIHGPS